MYLAQKRMKHAVPLTCPSTLLPALLALPADHDGHSHAHSHSHGHSHDHPHSHPDSHSHSHSHAPAPEDPWLPARNGPMRRGAGAGKILFIDASTSGAAGDMMVASLLDLGVPVAALAAGLAQLGLDGYEWKVVKSNKSGERLLTSILQR